jgi:hypothetical protein
MKNIFGKFRDPETKHLSMQQRLLQKQPLLNAEPEFLEKCNVFLSANSPKQGELIMGENGIEFRPIFGNGFIQIPWKNIKLVRAQVLMFGKYFRGFFIDTDQGQTFNFVVSNSKEGLRVMADHLPRAQLTQVATLLNRQTKARK